MYRINENTRTLTLVRGARDCEARNWVEDNYPNASLFNQGMYFMVNGDYGYVPELENASHVWCQYMTTAALENNEDVVVFDTFEKIDSINPYIAIAKDMGANISVIIRAPVSELLHMDVGTSVVTYEPYDGEIVIII
jgi:hypothetical protein